MVYIYIGDKHKESQENIESITIIPVDCENYDYQHKGPLILNLQTEEKSWTVYDFNRALHDHFKYNLWEEEVILKLYHYEDDFAYNHSNITLRNYLESLYNSPSENHQSILRITIYDKVKHERIRNNKIYHFKYNKIGPWLSFSQKEVDQGCCNDFYRFRDFIFKHFMYNAPERKRVAQAYNFIHIFPVKEKYRDDVKYKWPEKLPCIDRYIEKIKIHRF